MAKILIVEDDSSIAMGLKFCLTQEGFLVECLNNGESAKNYTESFDCMLLDLNLPDMHGFEVLKVWKDKVPVICLTACDEELSIVQGLDMGAYDYITKPFKTRELISRIKNILRRNYTSNESIITLGSITIDTKSGKVLKNGKDLFLTNMEYKILLILATNPKTVFTREQILADIWDVNEDYVNDNTLTVYIKRLREKIEAVPSEPEYIHTKWGVGYYFQ